MIIIYVDRRLVNLLSSTGIPADGWSLVEQVCDIPAKLENNIVQKMCKQKIFRTFRVGIH